MKSEPLATRLASAPDAFRLFFEALGEPAALLDDAGLLVAVNAAFASLCAGAGAQAPEPGVPLVRVLPSAAALVARLGEHGLGSAPGPDSLELTAARGGTYGTRLQPLGPGLHALTLRPAGSPAALAEAQGALAERARTQGALLALGQRVAGTGSEEELVAAVASGVKGLFPGRAFCIRITDARTHALTSLYAEGRLLREAPRERLVLPRGGLQAAGLHEARLREARVSVTDGEPPHLFQGSAWGLTAPLAAHGELFGCITVEYAAGAPPADLEADGRTLAQLAAQVAAGVRTAKLIDELTFVKRYLEELLEKANALIVVTDRERHVVVFNQKMSQVTGVPRSAVLGRDVLHLIPEGPERERLERVMTSALAGQATAKTFETRLQSGGSGEVRVSFSTSVVRTPAGDVEGVIAIGQDITAMKALEKRIIQAEKLASLGQLAAGVVHEINNPMTAVSTYANAMLQRSLGQPGANPADQEKLRKIIEASGRILKFTRDLVSYARPAHDRPERVPLHPVLDMAVGFCDHVMEQSGVSVERAYGDVPAVQGVRGNLVQVFVNLITNACHALAPGGRVRLVTRLEEGMAVVEVQDSGCGIAAKDLGRIFDPFFTTKPEGKGTGLGLSIVQGIVEGHGGSIRVDSQVGRGTTFTLRLPLAP